ncbi:universal stress protein [Haloarchaeobius sp. HRN-SO-5]|uniref:universal stress protein n=1 Tax=Haloarchaeobius sp. HRN-SO-5 TaxID=3446118 RepID=UPI003EBBC5A2
MIDRVLVPMDDGELAERALEYALEAHPDATITVLHVVGEPSPMMGEAAGLALEEDIDAAAEERAQDVFVRAREIAARNDREVDTAVGWGSPGKVIVANAGDYDTVVVGSHSSSLVEQLFTGNVAETVFRRSSVPVTVVR